MLAAFSRGIRRIADALSGPRTSGGYPSESSPSIFGGSRRTAAGVDVTPDTPITVAAIYRAVSLISRAECRLPLHLFERVADGRRRADDHPAAVLMRRPNPFMSGRLFRECLLSQLVLRGNAYAEIVRSDAAPPSLWLIPPGVTKPYITARGEKAYRVTLPGGRVELFASDEIVHWRVGGTLLEGLGPIDLCLETVALAKAGEMRSAAEVSGGSRPSGILAFDRKPEQGLIDNFRKQWDERHAGAAKASRLAFLYGEKVTVHTLGYSPADAEILEGRKFTVLELARWFNVPPHLLYDLERATFSNIEHQGIEFLTYTLGYWLDVIASELNVSLLTPEEQASHYFEHIPGALIQLDTPTRTANQVERVKFGLATINEVRRESNVPPHADGDVLLVPSGTATVAAIRAGETPKPAPLADPVQRRWIASELARAHRRHAAALGRASAKPALFADAAAEFWAGERPILSASLEGPIGPVGASAIAAEICQAGLAEALKVSAEVDRLGYAVAEAFGRGWAERLEAISEGFENA